MVALTLAPHGKRTTRKRKQGENCLVSSEQQSIEWYLFPLLILHDNTFAEDYEFRYLTEVGVVDRRNVLNTDLHDNPVPEEYVELFDYKNPWWFQAAREHGWERLTKNVNHIWADPGVKRAAMQLDQVEPDGHTPRLTLKKYAVIVFERLVGGLPGMRRMCSLYHLERKKKWPIAYVTKFLARCVGVSPDQRPFSKFTAAEAATKNKTQLKSGIVSRLVFAIRGT